MRTEQPTKCFVPIQKLKVRLGLQKLNHHYLLSTYHSKVVALLWFSVNCFCCMNRAYMNLKHEVALVHSLLAFGPFTWAVLTCMSKAVFICAICTRVQICSRCKFTPGSKFAPPCSYANKLCPYVPRFNLKFDTMYSVLWRN